MVTWWMERLAPLQTIYQYTRYILRLKSQLPLPYKRSEAQSGTGNRSRVENLSNTRRLEVVLLFDILEYSYILVSIH